MSTAFSGCFLTYFFKLALPAILPLLYSHSGVPADQNRSECSEANAAQACLSDTLEQSLSAAPSLRDGAARGTELAQEERFCSCAGPRPTQQNCVHVAVLRHLPDGLCSIHDVWQMGKEHEKAAELTHLHRAEAPSFTREHRLFIICSLSPWHLDALLATFSNVHFIISICNCIHRHFFLFLHTYL